MVSLDLAVKAVIAFNYQVIMLFWLEVRWSVIAFVQKIGRNQLYFLKYSIIYGFI